MNQAIMTTELKRVLKIWQLELNLEYLNPQKNVKVSFGDIGSFGEMLAINLNKGYIGSGSGGMGFDLVNFTTKKTIEVKTCCTIQNSKCNSCNIKYNELFLGKCPQCGNKNAKEINDSRFGINAKELLRQYDAGNIEKLVLCHISKVKQDKSAKELVIKLEWYDLDLSNKSKYLDIRLKYFENQRDKGKNTTANLLPNSYDFFKLTPQKIYQVDAKLNYGNINIEPEFNFSRLTEYPRISEKEVRFYKTELPIFRKLTSYDVKTRSADSKDFAENMEYREKSLGKERGDTRTNLDSLLI